MRGPYSRVGYGHRAPAFPRVDEATFVKNKVFFSSRERFCTFFSPYISEEDFYRSIRPDKRRNIMQNRSNFIRVAIGLFLVFFIGIAAQFLPVTMTPVEKESTLSASNQGRADSPILEPSPEIPPMANPQAQTAYGKMPMSFVANQGQTDGAVNFTARGTGYSLFLKPDEAVFAMSRVTGKSATGGDPQRRQTDHRKSATAKTETALLRMKLVGANAGSQSEGLDEQEGKINYFIGNDKSKWRTNISTFAKVQYKEVYTGIDMIYYGNQQQLEYDFTVAPGADYKQIKLNFNGAKRVEIDPRTGDLLLHTRFATIHEHQPVVYQDINGERHEIASRYIKRGSQVGFEVAEYDRERPLVIDPTLSYSTYLGGNGDDLCYGIAVDSSGNAYITGATDSSNFPTLNPFQNSGSIFVTKFSPSGQSLVYSTFISSIDGLNEYATSIAVDSSGNASITGQTGSTSFPTMNPFQATKRSFSDVFVTTLSANGQSLIYSSYLGGSDDEIGSAIAVDSTGSVYITGQTRSSNFPTKNPYQAAFGANGFTDAIVAKFNPALTGAASLIYSTYLGKNFDEVGNGIAVDSSGNAYVTGETGSTTFPTVNPLQATKAGGTDAFVTKFNSTGQALVFSTYFGGNEYDEAHAIAVDQTGNVYITGLTAGFNFPLVNPAQATLGGGYDAFVAKIDATGQTLNYSTYLGGGQWEL